MGREKKDFELVPHTSTHTTSKGTKITTKSLKIRGDYDSRQDIFRSLIECLQNGEDDPNLTDMSNTAGWKLIPFTQNTLLRYQTTELIQRQNKYLHEVHAILFINIRSLEGSFWQEIQSAGGSKRKLSVTGERVEGGNTNLTEVKTNEQDIEMNEGGGEEQYENGKPRSEEDPQEDKTNEDNEDGRGTNDKRMEDRAGDSQEDATSVEEGEEGDKIEKIEDTFLHMLRNSAGAGKSLFTLWEPG